MNVNLIVWKRFLFTFHNLKTENKAQRIPSNSIAARRKMEKIFISILHATTIEAFVAAPVAYKLNTGPKHIVRHLTVVKFEISFFNLKIFIHCVLCLIILLLFWILNTFWMWLCDFESQWWMVSIPYPQRDECRLRFLPFKPIHRLCYVRNIFQFTDSEFHVENILLRYVESARGCSK